MKIYRFLWLLLLAVSSFAQTHTEDTLEDNQTITGNKTFTGTNTFTTLLSKIENNVYVADNYPGATCDAKITAADAALSASGQPGTITATIQGCGSTISASGVSLGAGANNYHVLHLGPGTWNISGTVHCASVGSGIVGDTNAIGGATGAKLGPVMLKMANGVNLASVVSLDAGECSLKDIVIDGNVANNPTGGVGALVSLANRVDISGVNVQNTASHGFWVKSSLTGKESCCGSIRNSMTSFTRGDGIYLLNTSDFFIGEATEAECNGTGTGCGGNGTAATVNTTTTTITATAGSWSTDSSLVGTMLRVNNAILCQVLAIPSTTTITVAAATCWNSAGVSTALGVLTGVSLAWGNGEELQNSPTVRMAHMDHGGAVMDGTLIYGTTTGIGGQLAMLNGGGTQYGNNGQCDIEVRHYDTVGGGFAVYGTQIENQQFLGSSFRTPNNTWPSICLTDPNLIQIANNFFGGGSAPHAASYAISAQESSAGRAVPGTVGPNFVNSTYATGAYLDTTANGLGGVQIPVRGGASTTATFDLFDITSGAAAPHKYFRVNGGTYQILSNAGANIYTLSDAGAVAIPSTMQASQTIANQGVACTNGELALSAGWQSTGSATVTAAAGTGQTCSWTITTGTTTAANPTITDTLTNALPGATPVCWMNIYGGTHTAVAGESLRQTTLSATAPIFTANFTPTAAGTTYFVTRGCGP